MAGQPERDPETGQFASTELTRTRDAAIAETGEDVVYGMVEAGATMREIADALGLDGDDYTARRAVMQWLRRDMERYEKAKAISAEALAEKAGEVYGEETPETSADAKWRNDRSGYYRWLAEIRGGYGKQGGVQVNIGELHLAALKKAGRMDGLPPYAESEPVDMEAEGWEDGERPTSR